MFKAQTRHCRGGFTLIELLIVIAIIAILALIAIPNFLEAQTRSKVARAQADMRTFAVAIEAYLVDNNTYPWSVCPITEAEMEVNHNNTDNGGHIDPITTWPHYGQLTTPIAYITSIMKDPFSPNYALSWLGPNSQAPCHFYSGTNMQYANPGTTTQPRQIFALLSLGPDQIMQLKVDNTDADAFALYDAGTMGEAGGNGFYGTVYDPSNGTVSKGDIIRCNGDMKIMNIFFGDPSKVAN